MQPVIFLMGPTAAGKTALAVELAQRLPVELINVDSALIYRGLNIGAGRPDAATLAVAPHRLLGIRDITEPYSAADFRNDALVAIAEIHRAGRVPLLVGGTMMYFNILVQGLADLPAADAEVRARLAAEAQEKGWPALHARLAQVDAVTAARLAPTDSQRLQRALEVYELTGIPLSQHMQRQQESASLSDKSPGRWPAFPYTVHAFAVCTRQRASLHQRIEQRLQQMFADGLVEEVRQWHRIDARYRSLPAMRAVGYRQVWDYLDGAYDQSTLEHKALVATRQLAKRQLTWLRSWPDVTWLDSDDRHELLVNGLAQVGAVLCESQNE